MALAVGSPLGAKRDLGSQGSPVQAAPGDSGASPTPTPAFAKPLLQVFAQLR